VATWAGARLTTEPTASFGQECRLRLKTAYAQRFASVPVADLPHRRYSSVMRPPSVFHQRHIGRVLRIIVKCSRTKTYIVTRRRTSTQADALLFGRVTYEMMEAAWRPPARTGARPDWMEPFARTIDVAKKYVVSSTLDRVDWNAELVRGDLGTAVQQLKRESGKGTVRGEA